MTVRVVFGVAAAAVLALGVYLLVEVRAAPPPPGSAPTAAARQAEPMRAASTAQAPSLAVTPADPPAAGEPHGSYHPAPSLDNHYPSPGNLAINQVLKGRANPKLDAIMDQANKAYNEEDYEEAKAIAMKILSKDPANVRMLRIMVSASCIESDPVTAQQYYPQLPPRDQAQMRIRCDRYGVSFTGTQ